MKGINVSFLELDLNEGSSDTENESTHHVIDDNVSSPPRAHSLEDTSEIQTTTRAHSLENTREIQTTTPEIAQSSEPEVPHVISRKQKLLAERSKARGLLSSCDLYVPNFQ